MTCPAMNGSIRCEHYTGITRFNGGNYVLALCWYPHKANAAKFYEIDTRRAREVIVCPLNTTAQKCKPLPDEGNTGLQSEVV